MRAKLGTYVLSRAWLVQQVKRGKTMPSGPSLQPDGQRSFVSSVLRPHGVRAGAVVQVALRLQAGDVLMVMWRAQDADEWREASAWTWRDEGEGRMLVTHSAVPHIFARVWCEEGALVLEGPEGARDFTIRFERE